MFVGGPSVFYIRRMGDSEARHALDVRVIEAFALVDGAANRASIQFVLVHPVIQHSCEALQKIYGKARKLGRYRVIVDLRKGRMDRA